MHYLITLTVYYLFVCAFESLLAPLAKVRDLLGGILASKVRSLFLKHMYNRLDKKNSLQ